MIYLHAHWYEGTLHLWGNRPGDAEADSSAEGNRADGAVDAASEIITIPELRQCAGDVWDSLLVSAGTDARLTLRLPLGDEVREPFQAIDVPCLAFGPADALDLLIALKPTGHAELVAATTLRFWVRLASLLLELLSAQRFVPTLSRIRTGQYCSRWQVLIDDDRTSDRLHALIASMPPVCRAVGPAGETVQAASLVESFLSDAGDALVRRCAEGDELTHAIRDQRSETSSPQIRWLKSLIGPDPIVIGVTGECEGIFESVREWLGKAQPAQPGSQCRTCFRLHAPDPTEATPNGASWYVSVHLQASSDPGQVISASDLLCDVGADPGILRRPFAFAREQLVADLAHAARYFPPLARWDPAAADVSCALSLEEAYRFLRDAVPVLRLEGFGVWLPDWWHDEGQRLQLHLDMRPMDAAAEGRTSSLGFDALVEFDWRLAVGDENLTEQEIRTLADVTVPLVRLRGRWTEVHPRDLQAAIRFLDAQRSGTMTVLEGVRQCYLADDVGAGLPVAGIRAEGWIDTLLNATNVGAHLEPVEPPATFHGELRPYQLEGLAWLWFLTRYGLGGCLADDMGLGKTIQLIALWLLERQDRPAPGPTLLIVPMSLVGNWQKEIARFGPSLKVMVHHGLDRLAGTDFVEEVARHDVVISTYGLAHRDLEHLGQVDWYRVALDEGQNIKNPAARQSVAIRSFRAVHRLALTGTPVENHLGELWSIMDFLNRAYLGSARDFRQRFGVPIERQQDSDRMGRLRRLIRPFVLRRLKSDPDIMNDLPEKMEMKVYCNLTSEQAALYESVVDQMLGRIDTARGVQRRGFILAALVKLKQICNHPAHYLGDGVVRPHRSGKCDRVVEMLEEVVAESDHALVFTQFRVMGELLRGIFTDALPCDVLFLHGATPRKERDKMVERFQRGGSRPTVFVLSLRAGGFGLNLTAANHVFHFDRWWNPAVEDQASDRAHRIGQTRRVQVHKFVCVGTMEERIDQLLEEKRKMAERIIGGGESWLTELSTDGLHELFALSREAVVED